MRRGKILPALVLCFLALGFLLPRPAPPGWSATGGEDRIAVSPGDDGTVFSPRPPRRRVQPPSASTPFQALPAMPTGLLLPDPGRVSAVPDRLPFLLQPAAGAGVTRAGPPILSE